MSYVLRSNSGRGGEKGRKIVFDPNANEIALLKVDRLRKGDWYPYEGDR